MKKLILSLTLAAFALTPALQAGEGCCPSAKAGADKQAAGACTAQAKNADAKASCPMQQAKNATAKGSCCPSQAKKATVAKKAQSPKAAQLAQK